MKFSGALDVPHPRRLGTHREVLFSLTVTEVRNLATKPPEITTSGEDGSPQNPYIGINLGDHVRLGMGSMEGALIEECGSHTLGRETSEDISITYDPSNFGGTS